ncbi:hypothetical protein QNI19_16605 [Cytophagaceae bacterium DM2B3-1]|uniref:Uncharacterized protein n=1 Tax=Xanthocytophaga flava TaxID=3048013 RepID=A0ABT7CLD5_9BACT|nr:hypothetical protein [Xanthocytophaga flavus]MDJ1468201.1 hypothetical protein [Xanthocytophaga flavus]MDJ1494568.1 hypothetical protein [Xanthocytophaga flavus]
MSHNLALVLITNFDETDDYESVLQKLNLGNYKRTGQENLGAVTYDFFDNILWIGHYNRVLIVVNGPLAFALQNTEASVTEKTLINVFPHSDIVSLNYGSTSTAYNYVVIQNGKKTRWKRGSQDGTTVDYGEELDIEKELTDGDVISPEDLEDLRSEVTKEEDVAAMIEGMRGSHILYTLFENYLPGLELYTDSVRKIPMIEFTRE